MTYIISLISEINEVFTERSDILKRGVSSSFSHHPSSPQATSTSCLSHNKHTQKQYRVGLRIFSLWGFIIFANPFMYTLYHSLPNPLNFRAPLTVTSAHTWLTSTTTEHRVIFHLYQNACTFWLTVFLPFYWDVSIFAAWCSPIFITAKIYLGS